MSNEILVSAPGRITLFGEYSKLIGESVTISLNDIRTFCKMKASLKNYHIFKSNSLKRVGFVDNVQNLKGDWTDYISAAIYIFQRRFDVKVPYLSVEINSNIPVSAGLASSSSLVVSVINGVGQMLNIKPSGMEVANMAFEVESDILGIPCGQMDQYACSLGGVQYLNNSHVPPRKMERYSLPGNTAIVIGNSGIEKNTKQIINKIGNAYRNGDQNITAHIKLEKELIKKARKILNGNKQVIELGKLINIAHQSYNDNLHASNRLLNDLCITALENGAHGAKISGGGFGGCMFALTNFKDASKIKVALEKRCKTALVSKIQQYE